MEKGTAHYDLRRLLELVSAPATRHITVRARKNAVECGYATDSALVAEVLTLRNADLQKSMTSERDHAIWQDVYKVWRAHPLRPDRQQKLYIKLQESPDGTGVVISFHPTDP